MRTTGYLLLILLLSVTVAVGFWAGAQEQAAEPDPLRDLTADFLGVESDTLAKTGTGQDHRWNGRDSTRLFSYRTVDSSIPYDHSLRQVSARVVADPPLILSAIWHRTPPPAGTAHDELLDVETLERMSAEFLRDRFAFFGEDSKMTSSFEGRSESIPIAAFTWEGPGPGDNTHSLQVRLSRVDGSPCGLLGGYRAPAPPAISPINISEEQARELAAPVQERLQERFGDVEFDFHSVGTDTPVAEWGEPVYVIVAWSSPTAPWFFGIHATTGEILDDMLPPELHGDTVDDAGQ